LFIVAPALNLSTIRQRIVTSCRTGLQGDKDESMVNQEVNAMRLFRLYTGDDGQSHLQEMSLSFTPGQFAEQTAMQPAKGVTFSQMAPGTFIDWHTAPRRQYVITLAGGVEIGLGDGSVHRFGPGEGILAEDLTGKGHTTRAVGNEPRITVTIPLGD
jgi:hypothetical protein